MSSSLIFSFSSFSLSYMFLLLKLFFFSLIYTSLLLTKSIPRACSTTLLWFYALGAQSLAVG